MIIYLDILLVVNMYVTYFQIIAFSVFSHLFIPVKKKMAASLLASAGSFAIFLPENFWLLPLFIKILFCCAIVGLCTGKKTVKEIVRYNIIFLFINFLFAGLAIGFVFLNSSLDTVYKNGVFYVDIDFILLLLCTVMSYFVIKIIRFLLDKNSYLDRHYLIKIYNYGKMCTFSALKDSGNELCDYFSGLPVIVCKKDICKDISPPFTDTDALDETVVQKGIRILPFSTVSSNGFLYAFKPEKIVILEIEEKKEYTVDALVGMSDNFISNEYEAVFNPKLIV